MSGRLVALLATAAAMGAVLLLFVPPAVWRRRKLLRLFEDVAQRRGGEVRPQRWYQKTPTLDVAGFAAPARLTYFEEPPISYTQVVVDVPGPPGVAEIEVDGNTSLPILGRLLGTEYVKFGDPDFDEQFFVRCADEAAAWLLLDDQVRKALLAFKRCEERRRRGGGSGLVLWKDGLLTLRKPRIIEKPEGLVALLDAARPIVEGLARKPRL
jgi:hypothetical protein